jgi:hypothetical protein
MMKRIGHGRSTTHAIVAAAGAIAIGLFLVPAQPAAGAAGSSLASRLATIQPGQHPVLHVATPVNIVFVGYRPSPADVHHLQNELPAQGDPFVREENFWGTKRGHRASYRSRQRPTLVGPVPQVVEVTAR